MTKPSSILIRLPNWLGDMVMATSFVKAVQDQFPDAVIDLVAKKEIAFLADNFPPHGRVFLFSKSEFPGLFGARRFGKTIGAEKSYDLFFCLPDSLSSAVMAMAIRARSKVGFSKSLHALFFTKTFQRKKGVHRVEEYIDLLSQFLQKEIRPPATFLKSAPANKNDAVIININSEAVSRRLPKEKAVSIINHIRAAVSNEIILVGAPKEKAFVDEVFAGLKLTARISNLAGATAVTELVSLFASARGMLTTDSGPAHLANAVGTGTVVLFGAGNENNTAPFNAENSTVIRLGKLSCEPCTENICRRYGTPECLLQLDEQIITRAVKNMLSA